MAYRDVIIADTPVAYWRLGEASGTTAVDEIGGNSMTYIGSPTLASQSLILGDSNTAVALNGSAQYIRGTATGLASALNGAEAISFEAWVNLTAAPVSGVQYLFRTAVNGGSGGVNVFTTTIGTVNIGGRSVSTDPWQNIGASINFGSVVHVVGIIDYANDKIQIYLDGAKVADQTINFANAAYTVGTPTFLDAIGGDADGLASYLVGVIDEVAIYSRALTAQEVLEHYTAGSTAPNNAATGQPTITGTLTVGQTLTASTSAIADADGLGAFSYQWLADNVAISGATSSTFALTEAQLGADISVTVSFTDGAGYSESVTSAAVGPVVAAPDPSAGTVYRVESSLAETDYEWILLVKRDGD